MRMAGREGRRVLRVKFREQSLTLFSFLYANCFL